MERVTSLVPLAALLTSFILTVNAKGEGWSYEGESGPEQWSHLGYQQCQGERQSPINVVTNRVILRHYKPLEFDDFDQIPLTMNFTNNFHSAQATLTSKKPMIVRGGGLPGEYEVVNFHFHWGRDDFKGSEHTIDGESYPLEMHVVCKNTQYPGLEEALKHEDGLAVLGVMFEVSLTNNRAIRRLENALTQIVEGGVTVPVSDPPRLVELMPFNTNDFYRYDGSLTTPSCNEVVTWTIFLDTVQITERQLELFRALKSKPGLILHNYRPPQRRYGRSVFLSKPSDDAYSLASSRSALRPGGAAPAAAAASPALLLLLLLAGHRLC